MSRLLFSILVNLLSKKGRNAKLIEGIRFVLYGSEHTQVNMQTAYIYFVDGSTVPSASLSEVKEKFQRYIEMTKKTGQQLGWSYSEAAFPYSIEEKPEGKDSWLLLKGKDTHLYKYLIVGVGSKETDGTGKSYVQVSLPESATHGDKSKANEYCRYLAREFKAELHLFNGRVQYFQPRKP